MTELTIEGIRVRLWAPGPYRARSASDRTDEWPSWFVHGPNGINCLSFPDSPGAVLTNRELAEKIVAEAK